MKYYARERVLREHGAIKRKNEADVQVLTYLLADFLRAYPRCSLKFLDAEERLLARCEQVVN